MTKPLSDRIINGIPTVVRAVLILFLILIAAVVLFTLVPLFASVVLRNIQADAQIASQLASIDQQLRTDSLLLPDDASATIIFPQQIGDFQREDLKIQITSYCEKYVKLAVWCIRANYSTGNKSSSQFSIGVRAYQYPLNFDELAKVFLCYGGDTCSPYIKRENGNNSYMYGTLGDIFVPRLLTEVVWQNSDWTIMVGGDYEEITTFLSDFPYKQGVEE